MSIQRTQLVGFDLMQRMSSPVDIYTRVCTSFPSSGEQVRRRKGRRRRRRSATGAPLRNLSGATLRSLRLVLPDPASLSWDVGW